MSDATIFWDSGDVRGDFAIVNGDLATGQDLRTAVLISLFSWRRADPGDVPEYDDPQGWWGDSYSAISGDKLGSKLWLLMREKLTNATVQRARDYVQQALKWMLDEGVARRIDAIADRPSIDRLEMCIRIYKQDGEVIDLRFDDLWSAVNA